MRLLIGCPATLAGYPDVKVRDHHRGITKTPSETIARFYLGSQSMLRSSKRPSQLGRGRSGKWLSLLQASQGVKFDCARFVLANQQKYWFERKTILITAAQAYIRNIQVLGQMPRPRCERDIKFGTQHSKRQEIKAWKSYLAPLIRTEKSQNSCGSNSCP